MTKKKPCKNSAKKSNNSQKSDESLKSDKKTKTEIKNQKTTEFQTMESLLKNVGYNVPTFKKNQFVKGKLISINPKEVLVDIGGKAFAVVGYKELGSLDDLFEEYKVGNEVIGRVISEENNEGRVVVSLTKFAFDSRWRKLEKAYKESAVIKILVRDIINNGILVDYSNVRGYIPPSHIDPEFKEDPLKLRGQVIEVKILELDRVQNRLVVSQKLVSRKEEIKIKQEALKTIKVGDILEAEIEAIVPFGLFVNIDTGKKKDKEKVLIEGLVHISEIAWEKVDDPSDYYSIGGKISVKVLEKDEKEGKLNLSIKQTTDDPWVKTGEKYKKGDILKGVVTRETVYGVFIELEKGVEGLAHISNIPAGKDFKEGSKVTVQVEDVNAEERRIAFSIIPTEKPVMYR